MNDELKIYYQITTELWKMFYEDMENLKPTTEWLDNTTKRYAAYEAAWVDNDPYWLFAGIECSAKLRTLEKHWRAMRDYEQNNKM